MRALLETANPAAGTSSTVYRQDDGTHALVERQDVAEILDQNVRDANNYRDGEAERRPGGFRHIARIPMVVVSQLRAVGIMRGWTVVDEARFLKFLSDPDVRKLRCDNGRPLA